ncbi:hypothetical protein CHS0354_021076 [Potamilus streckersoni]|uniref:Uncharacterized protein n=1 Tax=Potamilus streckersoni TaxID=2493646 RepID=A0AAE0SEA9_9BIVA|nr:hypothetical protein CHS0354_021076 [Potamilus streckersoni]
MASNNSSHSKPAYKRGLCGEEDGAIDPDVKCLGELKSQAPEVFGRQNPFQTSYEPLRWPSC